MNLLITGALNADRSFFSELEGLGACIRFVQDERGPLSGIEPEDIDGVICNSLFMHHPIEHFPNLRYIQLTSAGYDRVPMDYVRAHEIRIFNAGGVYSIPIAEFVICGVLQIYKHSSFFGHNREKKLWVKDRSLSELASKTVCVIGCGSVGTECAKRFSAFGCKVIGVDPVKQENAHFQQIFSTESMDRILPTADIVVLTLPLTAETYHLFNRARLELLPRHSVLVNVSRGAVLDEQALAKRLPDLMGAVLDVFEEEPLPLSSPLWEAENVILTPHNSFVGEENERRLRQVIFDHLSAYFKEKASYE